MAQGTEESRDIAARYRAGVKLQRKLNDAFWQIQIQLGCHTKNLEEVIKHLAAPTHPIVFKLTNYHFQDAVWTLEKDKNAGDPDPRFNRQ